MSYKRRVRGGVGSPPRNRQMTRPIASARKNSPWGYKALVKYESHTFQPARKNFKTREEAISCAESFIVANYEGREAAIKANHDNPNFNNGVSKNYRH